MLETFKSYIVGEWQVISQVPATIAVLGLLIGLILWPIFKWAYGRVIDNQASEIKLLERQINDFEKQVDRLQKQPSTMTGEEFADTASLSLQMYSGERTPTRLAYDNIWRWYYLRTIMVAIEKETEKEHRNEVSNLFISFDKPVKVGTLEISSEGFVLPSYEVKEFTNRYAIIVFSKQIPEGVLCLRVHP
jgi:hypothetical protein